MLNLKEWSRLRKAAPYTEIRGSKLNHVLSWPARVLICVLAVLLFVGSKKLKWSPVIFIAISAVVGIVFQF